MLFYVPEEWTSALKWLPGKTNGEGKWLPAWRHMLDTAMMMQMLLRRWVPQSIYRTLEMRLEADEIERVAVLAAMLHDIGKLTPVFAAKLTPLLPEVRGKLESVGLHCDVKIRDADKSPHALAGAFFLRCSGCKSDLVEIVAAHHGKPCSLQDEVNYLSKGDHPFPMHFFGAMGRDSDEAGLWQMARDEWLQYALCCCGYESLAEVPQIGRTVQMLLSGLLIVADWIASNESYFPLLSADESPVLAVDEGRAERAWSKLKLPEPWMADGQDMDAELFSERFRFSPNAVQRAMLEAVQSTHAPGLFILEAQMGVGKTEAALAAAEVLAGRWGAGGVYFGLPTQATANGIYPRLSAWAQTQSQECSHAIRLAHGMAQMNEDYRMLFSGRANTDCEDAPGGLIIHPWFEGRKQALLADFVIGTVDQLLMAGLKRKHVMLRHLGLAGKVVILDECHAYDAYMNEYLERVLSWLGGYQVPVILLSATLPAAQRAALMKAYGGSIKEEHRTTRAYPLLTWSDGKDVDQRAIPIEDANRREVRICPLEREGVVEFLTEKLSEGGCAAVLLNTVRQAQEMARALREQMPECEVMLVHACYMLEDRAQWEKTLLDRMGKKSTPEKRNRLIVVGTQVMEQSLDIDADVMITEQCPMDLFLQRLGRLHRHDRERPEPLQRACCAVLAPGDGSIAIYGSWLLEQTRRLMPEVLVLPDDISNLVQDAYADPPKEDQDEDWEAHSKNIEMKRRKAEVFCLKRFQEKGKLGGMLDTDAPDDERYAEAAVRDGSPSIEVILLVKHENGGIGLVPWHDGGRCFSASRVPGQQETLSIARQKIRLPQGMCHDINGIIAELESITRRNVPEWQNAGLLHGELFLLLDDDLRASLGGYDLSYRQEEGLRFWKEEGNGTR